LTNILSTFYGFPAERYDESHLTCVWTGNEASEYQNSTCTEVNGSHEGEYELQPSNQPLTPMFTMPADCSGQSLKTKLYMDDYEDPARIEGDGAPVDLEEPGWTQATYESPPVTGCDALRFVPSTFTFSPEAGHSQADEPSGYESVLKIPQTEAPSVLATPPVKTTIVTLPAGVSISPSAADGLQGCSEEQLGMANGVAKAGPGNCPEASKVGTVEIATPLLDERITEGSVYVAEPTCGGVGQVPCTEEKAEKGEVFAIYLEVSSANRGVHIKLKGTVEIGGNGDNTAREGKPLLAPGQIRTRFVETPQFPFTELKFNFNGGPRAPLSNPQTCGTFTTNASLEPWSAPDSGPNVIVNPSFNISGGCGNGFAPSFTAGTFNAQAGAYTAFTTTFGRHDGEQDLSGVEVKMPEGLLGKIAGITQCGEAEANAGTCPESARVGTATAAAGSGTHPFYQSGKVYLTGPYDGAPFGLSVVVPAVAGPYNLGLIVTRARIEINPTTAAVTVVSNPLPQSVDGVPLRLQQVNVTVGEGDDFTFNATSCPQSSVGGVLGSIQGASANVSSTYATADCQALKFAPQFTASTQGNGTTKGHGASLKVNVGYPQPYTSYANIAKVDTSLPLALSSRLTTLQKACTEGQFAADPAGCPSGAMVGTATVHTPTLSNPLVGPAILVSHGGRAFPDLDLVLQGENGVEIVLVGNTDIKNGITYSKFETVPDAPVSSFELNLPEKEDSILGAVKNLCAPTRTLTVKKRVKVRKHGRTSYKVRKVTTTVPEALIMPTEMTGQNGAYLKQNTPITVSGCTPTKLQPVAKPKPKQKKKGKKGKGHKK
jgi:hypothetical protein